MRSEENIKVKKDTLCEMWSEMFPTPESFRTYTLNYFNTDAKSWSEQWEFTQQLLDCLKDAMNIYHELPKDDQKLPNELKKIRLLREQCVVLHGIRSKLATDYQTIERLKFQMRKIVCAAWDAARRPGAPTIKELNNKD